jgi:YebC/PmpR family DNA-binding regulatory protein
MAGHSKWANIQHRKGAQDKKRAKIFTKLIREITVSAKINGDPDANPRLRRAVATALSNNMTRDTIDKAIKRGAGSDDNDNMMECVYEGYGPFGTAFLVECLTDNKNRTVGEVRHAFTKAGGNLGTEGSVAYLFKKQGIFIFAPGSNEEMMTDIALNANAEDLKTNEDGSIEVTCAFEDFDALRDAFENEKLSPVHAEVAMVPSLTIELADDESREKIQTLIDKLEDLDDVQNVFTNADI